MDGPRRAGPAIAEPDDCRVNAVEESIHFRFHSHPFLGGAPQAAPERDLGSRGAQAFSPDLAHPIPGPPQHVNPKSDLPPGEIAYIGSTARDVITERGRWIEHIAYGHKYTLSLRGAHDRRISTSSRIMPSLHATCNFKRLDRKLARRTYCMHNVV